MVVYSSGSGNTKKIAIGIAEELKCEIVDLAEVEIKKIDLENVDTIFLGSGVYCGKLHKNVIEFAKTLNFIDSFKGTHKNITFFVTWLGRGKSDAIAINNCEKLMDSKNIEILEDHFECYGESFKFFKKGHPDESDIKNAQKWANNICEKL